MAKNFAHVIDGEVINVYRGLPDDAKKTDVSRLNAAQLFVCPNRVEPGWSFDGERFSAPANSRRRIPPEEFKRRFSQAQRRRIRAYSRNRGADATAFPLHVDDVDNFWDLVAAMSEVHLEAGETQNFLSLLEIVGIIDAADKERILA